MTEYEKAYLAGIIDGEGCITMTKLKRNRFPSPQVTISNTSKILMDYVKKVSGVGFICIKKPRKLNHKISYQWIVVYRKAIEFLKEIYPYLLIKKEQAELIINNYDNTCCPNGKHTKQMIKEREELTKQIKELNRRGVILAT